MRANMGEVCMFAEQASSKSSWADGLCGRKDKVHTPNLSTAIHPQGESFICPQANFPHLFHKGNTHPVSGLFYYE